MFTFILLLVIAALCFAYLRSTRQTESAKTDAQCWKLLSQMYWNWSEDAENRLEYTTQQRDDAWLSIEVMALGLEQERAHFERSINLLLNSKETPA